MGAISSEAISDRAFSRDGAGDPGSIGDWDGRMPTRIITLITIPILTLILIIRHRLFSSNLRCIANRSNRKPIIGISAKIRKVTTRTSKNAREVG